MKLKLLLLATVISCSLYSQTDTESISLVYDTSGYLENSQQIDEGIVGAPIDGGNQQANAVIPTINAEMNINESGALSYMLPIETLKGINNFQPNIALAYSSQSGNGQAGWGWNIVGLSMISTGGKSKEIDGITIGPQYDNTDPYYLDGQRLIKINDTDFVTEKFSKIKIQKFNSGDYTFIVKYTDGKIAKYKEFTPGQHYISVIIDAFNNEIHYGYSAIDTPTFKKTAIIDRISYGGSSVYSDKFYIKFNYKDRVRPIRAYRNGSDYSNSRIIDNIETSSSYLTGVYRTYSLNYDYIEGGSTERLRSISVSNESGEALKPVNFAYNSPTSSGQISYINRNSVAIPNGTIGLGSIALGDFYGSGEIEPVYQIKNAANSYSLYTKSGKLTNSFGLYGNEEFFSGKVLLNNRISKNDQLITTSTEYLGSISDDNDSNNPINNSLVDKVTFHVNDLISNLSKDVVVNLKGSTSYDYYDDPYGNGNQGGGGTSQTLRRDTSERQILSGDFNNDGLIDFLIYESPGLNRSGQLYLVEVGKSQSGVVLPNKILGSFSDNYFFEPNIIEFNGDGLPDFMVVNKYSSTYSIYKIDLSNKINGNDYNSSRIIENQPLSNFSSTTPIFFGDFNGDGLTDFMTPNKIYKMEDNDFSLARQFYNIETQQLLWNKYISTGTSFIRSAEDLTSQKIAYIESTQRNIIKKSSFWQKLWSGKMDSYEGTEYSTNNIMITDFNGDGRSDIIMVNKIGKIKYNTNGNLRNAVVENLSNFLGFYSGIHYYPFYSNIANKITYIQNVSGSSSASTFKTSDNPFKPIENANYSPFTLIAPIATSNQLNTYKSGVMLNDVLRDGYANWVVDNDSFLEKQIQQVDNGSGVIQKVEYRSMSPSLSTTEAPYLYNKEEADKFEYPTYIHNKNASFYLAHKIHTEFTKVINNIPVLKILTKEYRFENGVQNLEGKGFLGFQKTYVSDAYESEFKDGKYSIKNPFKAVFWNINTKDPLLENAIVTSSYGGVKAFFTFNKIKNEKFNRGNHQYLILSTEEESIDFLKKITVNKRYDYDQNDDLKLKNAYTDYDGIGSSKMTYTYKQESTYGDHYFYGKLANIEQTYYKDNLSFSTKEENDYYQNGNLQENRKYGNDPNLPPVITNSTYDNVGNLKTQTLSAVGIASQTTTYDYDTQTNRFVSKTTTPDGLFSSSVVNVLGRISEETSSLGLKTYYKYDLWGNIIEITDYLGKKTTIGKSLVNAPADAAYSLTKKREGGALTIVTFDKFDREIQSRTQTIGNKWVLTQTEYDILGRKERYSEPYFLGDQVKWNTIIYDDLNRPIKNISFTNKVITTCYEGMKVTVDDGYKKSSKTLDALGQTVRVQDHGGVISYSYYPNRGLKEINYEGVKTTYEIDDWGNKSKITDPSAGTFIYEYDNLSRITKETTPKGYTLYTYDNLGRRETEKTYGNSSAANTNIEKTFTYNPITKLPETITGTSNGKMFVYTTYYDSYYRIKGKKEQTPDFVYASNTTFDNYGRADIFTISTTLNNPNHTTSTNIKNIYDINGLLIQQNDIDTGKMVWQVSTVNASGKTTEMDYGNGYTIKNIYNESDNSLTDIINVHKTTGFSIVDIGYNYDVNKGVLNLRNNRTFDKKEEYNYDKLNRLTAEKINDNLVNEYTYDKRGRITSNTELGKYNYDDNNYKLKNINFNTNGQNVNAQRGFANVTYNAYRSPLQITVAGKDDLSFDYNILKTRYMMSSSVTGKQKLYSSDFVIEVTKQGNRIDIITFTTSDPYGANYMKKETLINGTLSESGNFFLHRDNQGSILAITKDDTAGTVVEKRYFDAWGNLKAITNAQQQVITTNPQMQFMDRGYTGHEHLQSVGLINMNARIYDPIVRKFLSADNLVSDPYNTQAYDRYSYVLNNPLLYIDLDGNNPGIVVAVVIAVAVAVFSKAIINMIQGIPFWYGLGKAATMGAISGAISFGIGSVATSAFGQTLTVGKAAFEAGMHAVSSGLMSELDGGKFNSGFWSGFVSSAMSSGVNALGIDFSASTSKTTVYNGFGNNFMKAAMVVTGGFSGGISSSIAGGSFWKGFQQGLITSGLNHVAHLGAAAIEEGKENRQIKTTVTNACGDDYLNQPVTEQTLNDMASVFSDHYDAGAKDYAFANAGNISGKLEINDGKLYSGGESVSGITNMDTGKVLFDPSYIGAKQMIQFIGTWYHETIHSIHVVSGFYKQTILSFTKNGYDYATARAKAMDVSEILAHFQTRGYGIGMIFPTPDYKIRGYGFTYMEFLQLK